MLSKLERYEWCHYWWGGTDRPDLKRILLIGDSITRGFRPYVAERLGEDVCVDMVATSKAVDNPALLYEIGYILQHPTGFRYEAIHLNNGLHGWHLSTEEYEKHFDRAISWIQERAGDAKTMLAASTPVTLKGMPNELDPKTNGLVLERNQAVARLAARHSCTVHDLYRTMEGYSQYRSLDGYHYNEEGQRAQAESVASAVLPLMGGAGDEDAIRR
ncbi:MAG: hydrolase family protein [Paenibacillaceae bacterium]|jgi:lysophospholipase L1-like esterase|nr:hydrolase family protein [Paenibacillaceae bacterium]